MKTEKIRVLDNDEINMVNGGIGPGGAILGGIGGAISGGMTNGWRGAIFGGLMGAASGFLGGYAGALWSSGYRAASVAMGANAVGTGVAGSADWIVTTKE